jgi:DNA-binding GntR family transcriptional regulator
MEISLNRETLGEQVTQLLREMILNGEFDDERLVESDLADRLSVSRTPVREALKTLEAAGLVRRLSNGHLVPVERSLEDMIEAFHYRIALETYAAGLTAQIITGDQLETLEEKCVEFEEAETAHPYDGDRLMKLGEEFHNLVVEYSGNTHIVKHAHDIYAYTSIYRVRLFRSSQHLEYNAVSHRDIVKAIRAGNSARSRQLMESHLKYALNLLKDLWQ